MKKTICTLALVGLSFLSGCYKPEANLKANNAPLWPIQGFISVTGKRFPYCEDEFKYDEFGKPQIIRRYYEVNPNGLDQLAAKAGIYLVAKSKGVDLLELMKKAQNK